MDDRLLRRHAAIMRRRMMRPSQGSDCKCLTSSLSLLRLRSKMTCMSQNAVQQ